ncbi:MAG: hypothetical protein LC749_11275 [Actinobacteria bacterium]|nr:hypothetical protein [Actinomycetota bacterium]
MNAARWGKSTADHGITVVGYLALFGLTVVVFNGGQLESPWVTRLGVAGVGFAMYHGAYLTWKEDTALLRETVEQPNVRLHVSKYNDFGLLLNLTNHGGTDTFQVVAEVAGIAEPREYLKWGAPRGTSTDLQILGGGFAEAWYFFPKEVGSEPLKTYEASFDVLSEHGAPHNFLRLCRRDWLGYLEVADAYGNWPPPPAYPSPSIVRAMLALCQETASQINEPSTDDESAEAAMITLFKQIRDVSGGIQAPALDDQYRVVAAFKSGSATNRKSALTLSQEVVAKWMEHMTNHLAHRAGTD